MTIMDTTAMVLLRRVRLWSRSQSRNMAPNQRWLSSHWCKRGEALA